MYFANMGWIAMDAFFVLSGLLITGILLDTKGKPGYYKNYLTRRMLRILPLYYLVLLVWWCIIRFTNSGSEYQQMVQNWGSPGWFGFYLGNFRVAMMGAWPKPLGYPPLWSLQIEEQYYMLFPIAVALLSRKNLQRMLIAALILCPILRLITFAWQPGNYHIQYVLLPCHCEGLALGGLIALRVRCGPWEISGRKLGLWASVLLGASMVGTLLSSIGDLRPAIEYTFVRTAGLTLSSWGCAALTLLIVRLRERPITAVLRVAPIRYLGKISYGIYMWHMMALWLVEKMEKRHWMHFHTDDPLWFPALALLTVVLAMLSWHLFEKPIMDLKERASNHFRRAAVAPAVTT